VKRSRFSRRREGGKERRGERREKGRREEALFFPFIAPLFFLLNSQTPIERMKPLEIEESNNYFRPEISRSHLFGGRRESS